MNAGKDGQAFYDNLEKMSDKTEREIMRNQKKSFLSGLLQGAAAFLGTFLLTVVLMMAGTSQAEAAGYAVTVKTCQIQGGNVVVLVSASPPIHGGLFSYI